MRLISLLTLIFLLHSLGCSKEGGSKDPNPIDLVPFEKAVNQYDFQVDSLPLSNNPEVYSNGKLSAQIQRTEYGVPHITADNLESLAFGVAYAYSEDNFCVLMDQMLKTRSERSLYFGPGEGQSNIISDLGYKALDLQEKAHQGWPQLSPNSKALIKGYVAGANLYLKETGREHLAPECANQPWVRPLDEETLLAHYMSHTLLKSGDIFKPAYLAVTPPQHPARKAKTASFEIKMPKDSEIGSNGWAIGRELSKNGRGVLLSNPHFANSGNLRFYQMHLTIPGTLNIMGVGLFNFPLVQIGYNENLGWTHTVSSPSQQFNIYRTELLKNNPSKYGYIKLDNTKEIRSITAKTYSIQVGSMGVAAKTISHTFYRTHHGLVIAYPDLGLEWDNEAVFSIKDANELNLDFLDHWLAMGLSKNLDEFQQAFKRFNGVSWVNTMYADKEGNAYYIDGSSVPFIHPKALSFINENEKLKGFHDLTGLYLFPGNHQLFEWMPSRRGLVPFEYKPQLLRGDYVQNSNDSFWLTNPQTPITRVSPLYGTFGTPLTPRTKMSLELISSMAGEDGLYTAQEAIEALYSNKSYVSEHDREEVLNRCEWALSEGTGIVSNFEAAETALEDISDACQVLKAWDGLYNPESVGAHVFRELLFNLPSDPYQVKFDPAAPLTTPNSLLKGESPSSDPVMIALAKAVHSLRNANIPLDAPLGQIQVLHKSKLGEHPEIKVLAKHGGFEVEGAFNIVALRNGNDGTLIPRPNYVADPKTAGLTKDLGYHIGTGTSFAYALEFSDRGPEAWGILTYSNSTDSRSDHFLDQDELYAKKQYRKFNFYPDEIEAHKISDKTIRQ